MKRTHRTCVRSPFFSCTLSSFASFLKLVFFMSSVAPVGPQHHCLLSRVVKLQMAWLKAYEFHILMTVQLALARCRK